MAWHTSPMRRERSVFGGAIQIAGVVNRAEADLLVVCGAESLGFPLRLDVHREDLSDADAANDRPVAPACVLDFRPR
jgi:hypothetical protein